MDLHGHLLYVDITQICGIGCAFCMYADKHVTGKSMVLSTQARDNLSALINDPSVKRISVSGEGEPLNNIKSVIADWHADHQSEFTERICCNVRDVCYWHRTVHRLMPDRFERGVDIIAKFAVTYIRT